MKNIRCCNRVLDGMYEETGSLLPAKKVYHCKKWSNCSETILLREKTEESLDNKNVIFLQSALLSELVFSAQDLI